MNKLTRIAVIAAVLLVPSFAFATSDKTPPKITQLHIQSNGADPAKAKAGDTVTISVTANEAVRPVVLVESRELFAKAKNVGENAWDASYTVNSKDKSGKVGYLITLIDKAKNVYICASEKILIIPKCATTDGSSVSVYKDTTPPPPTDTTAPVIEPHAEVTANATDGSGAVVTYTAPTATDNSGTATVVCAPASGTLFPIGTTPVNCIATDAANNSASTTFNVVVTFVPQPFVMASQSDESNLCAPDWSTCFSGGSSQKYIELGQGSGLGDGTISHITIAKDENSPFVSQPWILSLLCYTDATYTTTCPDWVTPNSWNGQQTYLMAEFSTETIDNKHWSAYFTDSSHNTNTGGTSPVTFKPNYYYKLLINDNGWNIGAYGSQTEPHWVLWGMTSL
ncbi:MAG: HYR domain-containing protein [Candidatus Pacebacteria bacterium]|nr:HYR domain-containing protein [Candidatus Paceibacterota bacterium]